jgi:hypothetical protein
MSAAAKPRIARRPLLAGLLASAGIVAAGLAAIEAPRLLRPHYAPTPFDDLFARLPDRDAAVRLGAAYLSGQRSFDVRTTARTLRQHLSEKSLSVAIDSDLAQARLAEAHGWILPDTLVLLCALAAKAS